MPIRAGLRQLSEGEKFRFKASGASYMVVRTPPEFRGQGFTCYKKTGSSTIHRLYTNGEKTYSVILIDAVMSGARDDRAAAIRKQRMDMSQTKVFNNEVKRLMRMGYKMQEAKKAAVYAM